MALHIVFGKLGSYKTLYSMICGMALKELFGFDLMANFNIQDMDKLIQSFKDIKTAKRSAILLDEAEIFMNSRNSQSAENKALAQFAMITRKHELEVFFILPRLASLDINVRDLADFFHYMSVQGDYIIHECYESHMLQKDELILLGQNQFRIKDLEPFYSMYNTKELPTNFMKDAVLK